jgi:fumarate reductase flavoprotein subunit
MSSNDKQWAGSSMSLARSMKGTGVALLGLASGKLMSASATEKADKASRDAVDSERECKKRSWETKPAAIPASEIKNTVDADVVVVGAGFAGFCAALSAKEAGASTVIIEKSASWSARGGQIAAFRSKLQQQLGIECDYRDIIRSWVNYGHSKVKEELLWEWARKSGGCMNWLIDTVEPKGVHVAMWSGYYRGTGHTEFPVTHFFYTYPTDYVQKNGQIEGVGNSVLVSALEEIAKEHGIQIHYKTKAAQLIREGNGPVTGVIAGSKGNYTRFNASKAVIITTGDFASNKEMRERYAQHTFVDADTQMYYPSKCNTGDGHIMAMHIGGAMQKTEPFAAMIHGLGGASAYDFMHVNALGKRYHNEDVDCQSQCNAKAVQPGRIAWSVCDADGLSHVKEHVDCGLIGGLGGGGQPFLRVGMKFNLETETQQRDELLKRGIVVSANTIESLAQKMDVPVENFVATVKRYNEMCVAEHDSQFDKRRELLNPVVKAPFYAGKMRSMLMNIVGGLRTNANCEVLGGDDAPVGHLYVAGVAAGDFFAGDYTTICPGISHGRCLTFGRLAGIIAAGKNPDDFVPSIVI